MNSDVERLRTLSIDDLAEILGCSVRTIGAQLTDGTFPIKPVQGIGRGTKKHPRRWSPFVVEAFLRANGRAVSAGRSYFKTHQSA